MSSTIIDETVILRYLLDDDEVLSPRAAKVIATRTARVCGDCDGHDQAAR